MTAEHCREWRESLGAYALGQLDEAGTAGLRAHLEGCPEMPRGACHPLEDAARLLPLADPDRQRPAPAPPAPAR